MPFVSWRWVAFPGINSERSRRNCGGGRAFSSHTHLLSLIHTHTHRLHSSIMLSQTSHLSCVLNKHQTSHFLLHVTYGLSWWKAAACTFGGLPLKGRGAILIWGNSEEFSAMVKFRDSSASPGWTFASGATSTCLNLQYLSIHTYKKQTLWLMGSSASQLVEN